MKPCRRKIRTALLCFAGLFCCFLTFSACESLLFRDPRPAAGTMTAGEWQARAGRASWYRIELAVPGVYELTLSAYNAYDGGFFGTPNPAAAVYPENAAHFTNGSGGGVCLKAFADDTGLETRARTFLSAGVYYITLSDSGTALFDHITKYKARLSLFFDFAASRETATLGTPIDLAACPSVGDTWFEFDILHSAHACLTAHAEDGGVSAILYNGVSFENALPFADNGGRFGTLAVGRYFLRIATATESGTVLLDTFDSFLAAAPALPPDGAVPVTVARAAGAWLTLDLAQTSYLQFSVPDTRNLTLQLFAEETLNEPISVRGFDTSLLTVPLALPAGVYYAWLSLDRDTSLDTRLAATSLPLGGAPALAVGTRTPHATIPQGGTWYALTLPAPAALEITRTAGLKAVLFNRDNLYYMSTYLCAAPAGSYYVWLAPTNGKPTEGHLLIRDLAAAATEIKVSFSKKTYTVGTAAEWLTFTVKKQTAVNLQIESVDGLLYPGAQVYATNLLKSVSVSPSDRSGVTLTLQPGTYYLRTAGAQEPYEIYLRRHLLSGKKAVPLG
ncbi:MAG: hypothetical protein LBM78_01390 [Clostridiales bacterium]|nr:hypothetical protein [Clostridiales bacterium]